MAAPIIISRARFAGPLQAPQLSDGSRTYAAEMQGAQSVFRATTSGIDSVSAAMMGNAGREAQARIQGADAQASAEIGAAQRETQAEIAGTRAVTAAGMQSGAADVALAAALDRTQQTLGNAILEAQYQTRVTEDQTKLLKGYEAARSEFRNDPDWQTAPTRLEKKLTELDGEVLGRYGPSQRAALERNLFVSRRSLQREVEQTAISKMGNAAIAAQTEKSQLQLNQAGRSPSAAERGGLIAQNDADYDALVAKGIVNPTQAQAAKQNFRQQLDQTDLLKGIQKNPAETVAALDDPAMFPTLSPAQRESARAQAQAALDERRRLEASDLTSRDPTAAAATYARDPTPGAVRQVVERALIPQESSGNPDAQSPKGAAGLTQFMPDTARGMARKLGITDLDGLDDAGVRAWLKANPARAVQMTERMLGDDWKRYGNLGAAFAAYHAGQRNADKWHAAAVAQFGPGYSVAQLISVIPDSVQDGTKDKPGVKTKDYVAQMYARLGADPGRGGVSTNAAYRISDAVESGLRQEQTQRLQQIQSLVSVTQDGRDAIVTAFKSGYAVEPAAVVEAKLPLIAAANAGDAGAVQKLRLFTEMEQAAPLVQQAYAMPPAQLESAVAGMRAAVANGQSDAPSQRRLEVFESVLTEVNKQRVEQPIALMERAGRAPVTALPIPAQGLPGGDAGFSQALTQRAIVASDAQRIYGGEIRPLRPAEARDLKQRWDAAGPNERYDTVRAMAASVPGPVYEAAVKQIAGDDAVAAIAGVIGQRNTEAGRMVMQGVAMLGQPGVDAKASELRPALQNVLGRDVFPGKVQEALITAAQAHYVAARAGKGALFDVGDSAAMEASIEAVAGRMAKRAGVKVPLPAGMRPSQLDSVMDGLTESELGGPARGAGGQAIDMSHLRRHARLRPEGLGTGLYSVALPGAGGKDAPVFNDRGVPLFIDLGSIAAKRAPVVRGETPNDVRRETIYGGIFSGARP